MLLTDTFSAAQENLIKNYGTSGLWFAHTTDYYETQPKPRVRLDAIEIANRHRKCLTTAEISGFVSNRTINENNFSNDEINTNQKQQLRLRTLEAQCIAEKSKSQSDHWYDFAENLNYKPVIKPPRIGAGEIGKAMTQESDWFQHKSFDQSNAEVNGHQKKSSTSSSYNRRNEENNWFAHPQVTDQLAETSLVRPRVKYEGIEYSMKNRGLDDLLNMKMPPVELQKSVLYGCPTEEAQNNALWSKTGTHMALCLGKQPTTQDSQILDTDDGSLVRPRSAAVRGSDAEKWRQLGRNGYMGGSMFLGTKQGSFSNSHNSLQGHSSNTKL
ncbi:unnamed protein product [Heterobilharzia americana]|nr:unnamed protein product [Heterobilharzia americana]